MITCSHRCIQVVHRAKQNTTSQETQLNRFQSNNSFWRCFLLSEALCETSTVEMPEFSSRSWSQGRDGFLAVHDDLNSGSWQNPWRPQQRPYPHLCRLGNRGLRRGSDLPKPHCISEGTGIWTLLSRVPQGATTLTLPTNPQILTSFTGPRFHTGLSAWLNTWFFLKAFEMTKNGSGFSQPSLWSPGNTTLGYFYKRFCGQVPCFPFQFSWLMEAQSF